MSTISIHNLDSQIEQKVKQLAKEKHQSVNKTIKDILGKNFDQTLKKTKKPGFQLFRFMAQIKSLSLKI